MPGGARRPAGGSASLTASTARLLDVHSGRVGFCHVAADAVMLLPLLILLLLLF